MKKITYLLLFLFLFFNSAFAYTHNICHFFKTHPTWYWTSESVQHKWHVPMSVQVAIMQEESRFHANALTPQRRLFGIIPWGRRSSAEGFAQALDGTWHRYIRATHKISADRTNFDDADDFLGWYVHLIHRNLHIRASDAFRIYLAYHEGIGGYRARTYHHKPELIYIAHEVAHHARRYHYKLLRCEHSLPKKPWWRVW